MIKYKSVKTYERLKEIQPQIPEIELSNKEDIDNRLASFCNQYRRTAFPDAINRQPSGEANNGGINRNQSLQVSEGQRKVQIKEPATTIGSTATSNIDLGDNLSGFLDNKFKLQLQRNMHQENSVVKMFGNALIATVFQSLIIKTIESLYKISINIETNLPISSNVLKAFDISTIVLSSFKTQSQKADYILSCMDKTIEQMFSSFKEKQEFKERKLEEQEKQESKKHPQHTKDDHFPWLRVKTKYESLRKKLNTSIIEKLNDYENLVKVLEKLKEKQELKRQGKETQASNVKYVLQNINMTSTKEIFQNMSKYGNPKTQQFLSRLGLSNQNDKLQTSSFFKSQDQLSSDNTQTNQNNAFNSAVVTTQTLSANAIMGSDLNFWNSQKEQAFKQGRQDKKKIYYNEVSSSSWNEIGFLPFVQKYFIEMKKSMQRGILKHTQTNLSLSMFYEKKDHLLDRYADGEWLTAEELKLLANTSELLNSCIDRKFMQNAVDVIDKDIISNLELGLAEDILKDYEEIQIEVKKSRQQFIKGSLQRSYQKLREYDERKQKERDRIYNKEYHEKKQKMLTSICYKMERECKFKETPPQNLQGAEELQQFMEGRIDQEALIKNIKNINFFVEEFENEMNVKQKTKELSKIKEENWKKYILSISEPKQCLNQKFYQSVTRHSYHPPSKLFVQDERNAQEHTAEEMAKYSEMDSAMKVVNKKDEDRYKLNIKAHIAYKNPQQFRHFYTGGPHRPSRNEPFYNPLENEGQKGVSCAELKYIVMIQKKYRKHRQMKKMKEILETNQKDKFYEFKYKIEQIKHIAKPLIKIPTGITKVKDLHIIGVDDEPNQSLGPQSMDNQSGFHFNMNKTIEKDQKNNLKMNFSTPKISRRPLTSHISNQENEIQDLNVTNLNQIAPSRPKTAAKSPTSFVHSAHYTSFFLNQKQDLFQNPSEFKKAKEHHDNTPIEKQLRNLKLIEAARTNQFWSINTGKFVFSKRDLYLARDKQGFTALHWATQHRNSEFMQWLIDQGSDPNTADCSGDTPVHIAFKTDKHEIISLILNGGGDLNNINLKGETPLSFGSEKMRKLLNLESGTLIVPHSTEMTFDNNALLKFVTQDDILKHRKESYAKRFSGTKQKQRAKNPPVKIQKINSAVL